MTEQEFVLKMIIAHESLSEDDRVPISATVEDYVDDPNWYYKKLAAHYLAVYNAIMEGLRL